MLCPEVSVYDFRVRKTYLLAFAVDLILGYRLRPKPADLFTGFLRVYPYFTRSMVTNLSNFTSALSTLLRSYSAIRLHRPVALARNEFPIFLEYRFIHYHAVLLFR